MREWRLLDTGFSDCYTNMAIDEAILLEYFHSRRVPTLRLYGWQPEAFSLGYFQDPASVLDLARCKEKHIDFVRRITGGGTLFHKNELTYSIVCLAEDISSAPSVKGTFKQTCAFLIDAYRRLGLEANFSSDEIRENRDRWICLSTREKHDIVIKGKKLGGNAQKRLKEVIFQHGSIPLKSSIAESRHILREKNDKIKENACFLEEVLGYDIGIGALKELIKDSFRERFQANFSMDRLTKAEKESTKTLIKEKYTKDKWNILRNEDCYQKARVA